MMKKVLAILLAVSLFLTVAVPLTAFAETKTDFEAFDFAYTGHGYSGKDFRFIMKADFAPFEVTDTNLLNLKVEGTFESEGKSIPFSSYIKAAEVSEAKTVLIVPETKDVVADVWRDSFGYCPEHTFNLKIYPELAEGESNTPATSKPAVSEDEEAVSMDFREGYDYYFLSRKNFENSMGGWNNDDTESPFGALYGYSAKGAEAKAEFTVPYDGTYYIWARVRDFAANNPGTRYLNIAVDGVAQENPVGKHGKEGYYWETGGSVDLTAGSHTISVINAVGYGRFDMICVTDDARFKPADNTASLKQALENPAYDPTNVTVVGGKKPVTVDPNRPNTEIAVKFNEEYLTFDVDPILLNDRTMVPMRAIFEKLGCDITWDDATETATAKRNGTIVTIAIGSNVATVSGESVYLDQSAVLMNDRTLVPLRFVSEALGCYVEWQDETQTVFIEADEVPYAIYINGDGFKTLGTWNNTGDGVLQGVSNSDNEGIDFDTTQATAAVANINITKAGTYKLWIRAKDFATNKPGTRFFHIAFDGEKYPDKFGDHGQDGFAWEEAGTYTLEAGTHTLELLDTSGFYARFNGAFLTDDLDFVPPASETELRKVASPYNAMDEVLPASYPSYASESIAAVKTDSIENGSNKIVFYQGQSSKGTIVQTEIYAKDKSGSWQLVKGKTEENGFLMKTALSSEMSSNSLGSSVSVEVSTGSGVASGAVDNYYRMGNSDWLIPDDFIKVSDTEMKLYFPVNDKVDFTATYSFDSLVDDVKVTINASFKQPGDYSFAMYSGDGVEMEDFDTVTAPMLYVKHDIPDSPVVITQPWMFTPMNTLHFAADNNKKTPGMELTSGLVVDPTCVDQRYSHPDTASFGTIFYTTGGRIRPSLVAPMMGTDRCTFETGDTYSFSYRVVNRFEGWYDTFKHVAVDMYNCNDIRTNYYGSINDSIYNITDLMMDDFYGGWDDDAMGWYNMEGQNLISQSNVMILFQRYLLSEDRDLLEERVVPTIAYALSRGGAHFLPSEEYTTLNYGDAMRPLSGYASLYGASVWGGMYEMSQGRMPYLLDYALNGASKTSVRHSGAVAKYTGSESDKEAVIKAADAYLNNNPMTGKNRDTYLINGFVYGDYTVMATTLLSAYELTGEQKYLDAAEEAGRLLMTVVWTTGYQNDYATNTIHVDPVSIVERPLNVDTAGYNFFWHGSEKWRPGNEDGYDYSAKELLEMGTGITIPEEDIPGWLVAPTAHGTEHAVTPGHGNVITMNNWLGAMVRLSEYTGDDWFETQARNAIVGRYQNYPGYYIDRYVSSPMHADYPYVGPDITSLYWHHIPIYLAMVEDFLINEAWAKSNRNIDFPYVYQDGYAYFNSYQFGQEAGKFYDEEDMWLWITKGIIETDNINVDYVTARKDGVLGIALMNEDNAEITTTVQLGEKIPNSDTVNGTAVLYDENGTKSTVEVVNGAFTVTIPSKGLRAVVIKDIAVETPEYVREYTYSNEVGQTVSSHTNGKGYTIQVVDDFYHAYVYITDTTREVESATLTYTVNGKTQKVTDTTQALEWLIKVEDPNAAFTYTIDVTKKDGTTVSYGGGTLKTLANSELKGTGITVGKAQSSVSNNLKFDAFDLKYSAQGMASPNFRFVVSKSDVPFEITKTDMANGLVVKGELVDGDTKIPFESSIVTTEIRDNAYVFVVSETADVSSSVYCDNQNGRTHKFVLKVYPQE